MIAHAQSVLDPDDVMDGVREVLRHLEVDALFPSGTALVAVDDPIGTPSAEEVAKAPGAIRTPEGSLTVNSGRVMTDLEVTNTGEETVFVSSHYHFFECNPALQFDRRRALGMRLDIAAGTAVSCATARDCFVAATAGSAGGASAGTVIEDDVEIQTLTSIDRVSGPRMFCGPDTAR